MIAAALTDVAGSSAVFDRGVVTYSYASKTELLGVLEADLATHGAVSEPVARQMALGALERAHANVSVAVTGVAGPGAEGEKPEGMVWFALATSQGVSSHEMQFGALGRAGVREATVAVALRMVLDACRSKTT